MAAAVVASMDQDESDASLRATKMTLRLCEVPVNLWDVMEPGEIRIRPDITGMTFTLALRDANAEPKKGSPRVPH